MGGLGIFGDGAAVDLGFARFELANVFVGVVEGLFRSGHGGRWTVERCGRLSGLFGILLMFRIEWAKSNLEVSWIDLIDGTANSMELR